MSTRDEYSGPLLGYQDDLVGVIKQDGDVYWRAALQIRREFDQKHPPCSVCGRPATIALAPPEDALALSDAPSIRYAALYSCGHVRQGDV